MTNNYFAIALVGAHTVGVPIRAESIATAFEVAEHYLQERHPRSVVIVQAVQRITKDVVAAVTPAEVINSDN